MNAGDYIPDALLDRPVSGLNLAPGALRLGRLAGAQMQAAEATA